jgi:hypothetical protein
MKLTLAGVLALAVVLALLIAAGAGFPWSELPGLP